MFLGGNAPVHQPDAPGLAVKGFDFLDDLRQGLFVKDVAVHDFVAHGESLGRDDQRQHDLFAVKAMIAAVAVAGFLNLPGLALEIGAGQVVEQHVELGSKKVLPSPLQVGEESVAMLEQLVQHTVKLVLAAPGKAFAQQVAHGAALIPYPVTAPFAARLDEPIGDRHIQ